MASVLELILRSKREGTGAKDTAKDLGALEKLAKKLTVAFLAMTAFKVVKNAALLAARVETLGVVTKKLGENVGLTEEGVRSLEQAIVDQGITLQGSRQAIAMMIQSNVDLANATDLARLAQDTAVIANVNSSEAFQQLTRVLQTGNVRMARTLGLNVQFGQAQKELAASLGKTTAELSEQEIMQARTNAVMKAGTRIAGTYEAAMETSGKKILSMDRLMEELQRTLGEIFLPVLAEVVDMLYESAKAILSARDAAGNQADSIDALTKSYTTGQISIQDYVTALQDEQKAIQDTKAVSGFGTDALLTYQEARIALIFTMMDSVDAHRKDNRQMQLALERANPLADKLLELSLAEKAVGIEAETAGEKMGDVTESSLLQAAAEALLAGNFEAAKHLADMAHMAELDALRINELIDALDELDGKDISAQILVNLGFNVGGATFWEGIDPIALAGGEQGTGMPRGGWATWGEAVAAGYKFVNGEWIPDRAMGGDVVAGRPYIVGEREAELFVPRQDGHIYNQQQMVGGDLNINTGISQRAFNNMAEDWMRGLGG